MDVFCTLLILLLTQFGGTVLSQGCDEKIEELNSIIVNLENALEVVNQKREAIERRLEADNKQLYKKLDQLKQRQIEPRAPGDPVAFTAALSRTEEYAIGASIVFDHVITNVGNGYDNNSGVFTCPITALYLFTATIVTDPGRKTVPELQKDGVPIGRITSALSNVDTMTGSNSFVVPCDMGSTVSLVIPGIFDEFASANVFGSIGYFSTFTGLQAYYLT